MTRLLGALAAAALFFAACGEGDDSTPADQVAPNGTAAGSDQPEREKPAGDKPAKEPKPGTEITVASSQFGDVLFDGSNQAIYLFDKETGSTPECYGECAAAWPPVLTDGEPLASGGAEQKLLGTTERDDGSTQVTYAGQPLYYYAHEGPGQVLCHNVSEFGGLWLVLDASGQAL
jgi:predicted lipoprotein with Yx(FWY)xxD motif